MNAHSLGVVFSWTILRVGYRMPKAKLLGTLLLSCFIVSQSDGSSSSGGEMKFGLSGTAAPNVAFALACTMSLDVDTTVVAAALIELAPGLHTISGDSLVSFTVAIEPGMPSVHTEQVIADSAGVFRVSGGISCEIAEGVVLSAGRLEWIRISSLSTEWGLSLEDGITTSDGTSPGDNIGETPVDFGEYMPPPGVSDSTYAVIGQGNDGVAGSTVEISGFIKYYDGNSLKPVVGASVQVYDNDWNPLCLGDDWVGSGRTDETGEFVIDVDGGDCLLDSFCPYIKMSLDNGVVRVGTTVPGSCYQLDTSPGQYAPCSGHQMGTFVAPRNGSLEAACKAFNNYNSAWTLLHDVIGNTQLGDIGKVIIELDGYVEKTRFIPTPPRIQLTYNDVSSFDVIAHEMAHAFMTTRSDYEATPEDASHLFDNITSVTTAWQEGFCDFLPLALKDDGTFDFSNGGFRGMENLYSTLSGRMPSDALRTEGLVARALYDLFDSHTDSPLFLWQVGRDYYAGGTKKILDVLDHASVRTSFGSFWNGWRAFETYPGQEPIMAIRLNLIDFNTAPAWTASGPLNRPGIVGGSIP